MRVALEKLGLKEKYDYSTKKLCLAANGKKRMFKNKDEITDSVARLYRPPSYTSIGHSN